MLETVFLLSDILKNSSVIELLQWQVGKVRTDFNVFYLIERFSHTLIRKNMEDLFN